MRQGYSEVRERHRVGAGAVERTAALTYNEKVKRTHSTVAGSKPLTATHPPRPGIRQVGKRGRRWLALRRRLLAGARNHEGYYVCTLCGAWVERIELDHIAKRSLAPGRVLDPSNVRLICASCHRGRHR